MSEEEIDSDIQITVTSLTIEDLYQAFKKRLRQDEFDGDGITVLPDGFLDAPWNRGKGKK